MLPTPAIAIKTLGGIIDLFVFVGDNPEQVTQLYTSVIGKPVMPPYWGLGEVYNLHIKTQIIKTFVTRLPTLPIWLQKFRSRKKCC